MYYNYLIITRLKNLQADECKWVLVLIIIHFFVKEIKKEKKY